MIYEIYRPLISAYFPSFYMKEDFEWFEFKRDQGFGDDDHICQWVRTAIDRWMVKYAIAAKVDCELVDVFELTNSIESCWTDNAQVSEVNADTFNSSSSVGDFFYSREKEELYVFLPYGICLINGVKL